MKNIPEYGKRIQNDREAAGLKGNLLFTLVGRFWEDEDALSALDSIYQFVCPHNPVKFKLVPVPSDNNDAGIFLRRLDKHA